ncbi:hypothetical protein AUP74_01193 [Microbulbifer aggregans]|uniref:Pili assembly chaperone N-terminal domain-containing protein n=1 Tax=Microbulbifer aggregans TaxID=1769779 RepID=A0A1C9W685_9GAMM|nr:fimbria/pilus periplasmic chaperone [Microbulbifer aggregans]AOS96655.1 hypothetical protein AUP74_01193 [Microbulbifer aggregans]
MIVPVRVFLISLLIFGLGISTAVAQSVTPTRLEIDIEKSPRAVLTLSSTKAVDVALELSVSQYTHVPEQGQVEKEIPLSVSPPQVLLQPGETRQVVVSWQGQQKPPQSVSYYLRVDELPLAVGRPENEAEIRLLTSLRLPVHVGTGGDTAMDFQPPNIDGSASLELINTGGKYALLSNYFIATGSESGSVIFDGLDIARLLNRDAILPGQTVSIPLRLIGLDATGIQGARLVRKE